MNKISFLWQILLLYALVTAIVYVVSTYSIFLPPVSTYDDNSNITRISGQNGSVIATLYLPNPKTDVLVIYSHGNAEDIGMIRDHVQEFYKLGYSILAYDYSGYGLSEGSPSERTAYANIADVYNYAVSTLGFRPKKIVIYGRSLGGGPSVDLAANNPVGAVILESTFVSAFRVVTYLPVFPLDKFNNLAKINKINVPILIIHGTADNLIPFWHGEKLYNSYRGTKQSYWVEGAGHNNILYIANKDYIDTIKTFINTYVETK